MFRLIRWFITLVFLIVILVVADRATLHVAQQKVATVIQSDAKLITKPKVVIHGFPFLTQAVKGRYTRISVTATNIFNTAPDESPGAASGSAVQLELSGVHIPLSKVVGGTVKTVMVDQVTGQVTADFADLAAASKVPGLTLSPGAQANEVTATESLTLAGLTVNAKVTASLSTSGQTIIAKPLQLSVGSAKISANQIVQLLPKAGFTIPISGLPPKLQLGQVSVGTQGVVLPLHQTGLVMTR